MSHVSMLKYLKQLADMMDHLLHSSVVSSPKKLVPQSPYDFKTAPVSCGLNII